MHLLHYKPNTIGTLPIDFKVHIQAGIKKEFLIIFPPLELNKVNSLKLPCVQYRTDFSHNWKEPCMALFLDQTCGSTL